MAAAADHPGPARRPASAPSAPSRRTSSPSRSHDRLAGSVGLAGSSRTRRRTRCRPGSSCWRGSGTRRARSSPSCRTSARRPGSSSRACRRTSRSRSSRASRRPRPAPRRGTPRRREDGGVRATLTAELEHTNLNASLEPPAGARAPGDQPALPGHLAARASRPRRREGRTPGAATSQPAAVGTGSRRSTRSTWRREVAAEVRRDEVVLERRERDRGVGRDGARDELEHLSGRPRRRGGATASTSRAAPQTLGDGRRGRRSRTASPAR